MGSIGIERGDSWLFFNEDFMGFYYVLPGFMRILCFFLNVFFLIGD
jgi:hypothetical protein